MQLFEKTEASGTIQDFIDTFKDAKVTVGEVNAMMFFNLKKEDARTLLITFNVFMAHIMAPIYTTTPRPKPTEEREAYNRERASIGAVIQAAFSEHRGDERLDITDHHCSFTGFGPGIVKFRRAVINGLEPRLPDSIRVVYTASFGQTGVCPPDMEEFFANFMHIDDKKEKAHPFLTNIHYKRAKFKSDTRTYLRVKQPKDVLWSQHIDFLGYVDFYDYGELAKILESEFGEALLQACKAHDQDGPGAPEEKEGLDYGSDG